MICISPSILFNNFLSERTEKAISKFVLESFEEYHIQFRKYFAKIQDLSFNVSFIITHLILLAKKTIQRIKRFAKTEISKLRKCKHHA